MPRPDDHPDASGRCAASETCPETTSEPGRSWTRAVFGTVPLAVAGSMAVAFNLATPAQATPPQTTEHPQGEKPPAGSTRVAEVPVDVPSAPLTTVATAPTTYTVASGDTVSAIAARHGITATRLLALNGLSWKSLIFPGQVLALSETARPGSAHLTATSATMYSVVAGDTIGDIAHRFGIPTSAVLSANGFTGSSLIFPGQQIIIPDLTPATTAPWHTAPAVAPAPILAAASGQVVPLTSEMRDNATLIVRVGRQQGVSDQAIVVALAAAAQESGLRNVRHGDRDSLGLFQQRPSTGWGTPSQILDPERATRAFFGGPGNPNAGRTRGLLDIPDWTSMSVTQAAQAVQLSAFPDDYAKWETSARAWLSQLG